MSFEMQCYVDEQSVMTKDWLLSLLQSQYYVRKSSQEVVDMITRYTHPTYGGYDQFVTL